MLLHPALRPCCTACYCTLAALCPAVISLHPLHCMPAALQVTASTALHFNAPLHCTQLYSTATALHNIAPTALRTCPIVHSLHCAPTAMHITASIAQHVPYTTHLLLCTPAALNTIAPVALHIPCIGCYCMPLALHATAPTVLHIIALAVLRFIAPPALHTHTPLSCPMHTHRWSPYPCAGCAQHTHRGHPSIAHTHTHRGTPCTHATITKCTHCAHCGGTPYTVQRHHPIRCTSAQLPLHPLHACCCRSPPRGLQPPEHPRAPPDPASRPSVAPRL